MAVYFLYSYEFELAPTASHLEVASLNIQRRDISTKQLCRVTEICQNKHKPVLVGSSFKVISLSSLESMLTVTWLFEGFSFGKILNLTGMHR